MPTEDILIRLAEDIGYIKGKIEDIDKKVALQNGSVASLTKRVNRYDIVFGKIGVAVTLAVFAFSFIVDIAKTYIMKKFNL